MIAYGVDDNNSIYPITYSVVEIESNESWNLFIGLCALMWVWKNGEGWTFISSEHPGIMNAVKIFIPMANHKHCTWHIVEIFKKRPSSGKCVNYYWEVVRVTAMNEFDMHMKNIKK